MDRKQLVEGTGTISFFDLRDGNFRNPGGYGRISTDDGHEVIVTFKNLLIGHIGPMKTEKGYSYVGMRVSFVALPPSPEKGFVLAKAIRVEPEENRGNKRSDKPSKIADPMVSHGR